MGGQLPALTPPTAPASLPPPSFPFTPSHPPLPRQPLTQPEQVSGGDVALHYPLPPCTLPSPCHPSPPPPLPLTQPEQVSGGDVALHDLLKEVIQSLVRVRDEQGALARAVVVQNIHDLGEEGERGDEHMGGDRLENNSGRAKRHLCCELAAEVLQ